MNEDEISSESTVSYSVTKVVSITGVNRETLVQYCESGLLPISPDRLEDSEFDDQLVNLICRVESLRIVHGVNLAGIRMILTLTEELENLRRELKFRVDADY